MLKTGIMKMIGLVLLSFVVFSCEDGIQMTLPAGPQGPQGNDGLSAYEVWVKEVESGNIAWDKDRVDTNNFFLYLKGADGKDGAAGKSAYEIWQEEVSKGLADPHNPGSDWSKDKITLQDFWYYLTGAKGQDGATPIIGDNGNWYINGTDTGIPAKGKDGENGKDGSVVIIGDNGNWHIDNIDTGVPARGQDGSNGSNGSDGSNGLDGQSAYELWKQEVANGLLNPHDPEGGNWPQDEITVEDFWYYLRGEDGKDGADGKDGEYTVGEPGKDVVIVKGKPNVVSQYAVQEYSEFVRWSDGGVLFIVYDDQGSVSPGAKVKGIPGVLDANKIYVADANGQFIVPKEDLPLGAPVASRFGATAEVEYLKSTGSVVKETSAPNTYLPNRMQIKIQLSETYTNHVAFSSGYDFKSIYVYIEVRRKTDDYNNWEVIPSYLGDLFQTMKAYELSDSDDPTSYVSGVSNSYYSSSSWNIHQASLTDYRGASISRLRKKTPYRLATSSNDWDGKDHYFNMVLESYYGENPHANVVIKMAPVQDMPLMKSLKAYGFNPTLNIFSKIEGEFDVSTIDPSLIFKSTIQSVSRTVGSNTFNYYYPELDVLANIETSKTFKVSFEVTENSANNSANLASIINPTFNLATPYLGSSVLMDARNSMHFMPVYYSNNSIGTLMFDSVNNKYYVEGLNNSFYKFDDIPVQLFP